LEYANAVWSPCRQKYTEALEKVQMRATKITINNKELSYPERLKILDIPTLVYRRHRGDMIEVYKIINGYYNDGCTVKLTLSQNTITRGHRFKLAHSHTHLDKRKYFFTNRVVSLWNDLSDDVVSAQTVNSFKSKLDKFWSLQHCKYEWRAAMTGTGAKYYL
jgi:ribonuclease P/MRP protein subunit RPP40